mmetsp:Transcript_7327/g.18554  ORF Transcript_7327/g.18554 Transcript_7327/m.18554 type:complete len:384 (-) Transcript_7327:81-1232(-)
MRRFVAIPLAVVAFAARSVNSFPQVRKLAPEALQQRRDAIYLASAAASSSSNHHISSSSIQRRGANVESTSLVPEQRPSASSVDHKIPEPESTPKEHVIASQTSVDEKLLRSQVKREQRAQVRSSLVSFLVFAAGIADVLSFKVFGFYASMMTGNTIRLCNAIVESRYRDAFFSTFAIAGYTLGSAIYHWLNQAETALMTAAKEEKRVDYRSKYKAFSIVAFSIFVAGDALVLLLRLPGKWLGPFLSVGFGFVNSLCSVETAVVNFAITGHIHKVGLGIVDSIRGKARDPTDPVEAKRIKDLRNSFKAIAVFFSAVLGAATLWQKSPHAVISFLTSTDSPPPLGLFFGIFYGSFFAWCASEFFRIRTSDSISPRKAVDWTIGL